MKRGQFFLMWIVQLQGNDKLKEVKIRLEKIIERLDNEVKMCAGPELEGMKKFAKVRKKNFEFES